MKNRAKPTYSSSYERSTSIFRKITSTITLISFIWSNCAWANGPLQIMEEDIGIPAGRVYVKEKLGVIDPGAVSDGAIHNIFDDFQLPAGSCAVFKNDSKAHTIFNRFYSQTPVHLAGTLQSENCSPMVFANPGGINLENPEFKNISALTIAAGGIANTDQGLAYGIDQGAISLHKTVFEQEGELKRLTLAGRTIQLSQSVLAPSDGIDLTVGQHIGGLKTKEELDHPQAYVAEAADPSALDHSILIDPATILRSKNLGFRSFDNDVPIYALGLLESTDGDIRIQAKGDIYLHHLIAARNLTIETTGRVFLGAQTWVGGEVHIKAKDINIDKGLSSVGRAFLKASNILNVQGNLSSEEGMTLKGKERVNLNATIAAKGEIKAKSKGDISQDGFLYTADRLEIEGNRFIKKGKILSEGQLLISTLKDIENREGVINSLSTSTLVSKEGTITNRGDIISQEGITLKASKINNFGTIEAQGKLSTMKDFFNESQGRINAGSLSEPLALLTRNMGLINLKDDVAFQTDAATLRGTLHIHGALKASGKSLTIEGNVTAQRGSHFDLKSLTNKGMFRVWGVGVQGNIDLFTNNGKADFSNLNATLKSTKNTQKGVVRTLRHFVLQGDSFENKGNVFTGGVHQATLTGVYEDSGAFYSPTLFLLNAKKVNYSSNHKSYLKDAVVTATEALTAYEKAELHMDNAREKSFLQLSSQGDLSYNGLIKQTSARFPLLDYYKIFGETSSELYEDFANRTHCLPQGGWSEMRPTESGIVLNASKNLGCKKAVIDPESGSISLIAEGQFNTEQSKIKTGFFKGNNASAMGKRAFFNETTLQSLFGRTSVLVETDLRLNNSHILGEEAAEVSAESFKMDGSSVKSSQGRANIQIEKKSSLNKSILQGGSSVTLSSQKLVANNTNFVSQGCTGIQTQQSAKIKCMTLSGKQVILDVGTKLNLSMSSLEGEFNKINAQSIVAKDLKSHGITTAEASQDFKLKNLDAKGTFMAKAEGMTLEEKNNGENLSFEAERLKNTSDVHAQEYLNMKAETIEQLKTTKSDGQSNIEATEEYIDTATSLNEAKTLSLTLANKKDFNGLQKADVLKVTLPDMDIIKLLNQIEARETHVHLKEGDVKIDKDLALQTNLYLRAQRLENRAKITGNDFIAYMETSIINQGSMDFHGKALLNAKQSINNTGDVSAIKGLGFETEGTFTHKGKANTKGFLSVKANKIDADAEVETYQEKTSSNTRTRKARFIIPSFSGQNIRLESETTLNARGTKFNAEEDVDLIAKEETRLDAIAYAEGDQETTVDLPLNLKLTMKTDPRNKYLQGSIDVGGNIRVKTAGKLDARGLQANAKGGSIVLSADQGVDLSSLAAVSVVERWNYNTGVFGQNNHRGFREGAEFYRTNLQSQGGGIYVLAKEGGITARGTAFQAQEEIRLDARDKVDVGTLKVAERYASHDEDQLLCFGSQDDKEGSVERFRQMQALSNKKIGIFSRQSSIEGDAPFMRAPEIELDGEKGIIFKPLELHSQEDTHHYENNLNLNPTNIEFEHKEKHTKTSQMQQVGGTLQADKMRIRTGIGAKAQMTVDVLGLTLETTDIEADTDELAFSGIKSTYDNTTDSWSVKISIDANMMPGGGFDVAHDKTHRTNYSATVQKFGTFHNKRKGAKLIVQGGAQTSINETTGEDMEAVLDKNAQDQMEKEGYAFGGSLSSTGASAHFSANGGGTTSKDNLTGLQINKQSNTVTRKNIEHETKDTRWGLGFGMSLDQNGKVSANAQVQVGGMKAGFDIPTDKDQVKKLNPIDSFKSMEVPKNLDSLQKMTQGAANLNKTLNDLGIDTGDLGKGIKTANQATLVGVQAQDSVDKAKSISQAGSIDQAFDRAHDTLSQLNSTAQTAGINTGDFGDFIKTTQSIKQTAKNAKAFGEQLKENLRSSESAKHNASSYQEPIYRQEQSNPLSEEKSLAASAEDKTTIVDDSEVESENLGVEAKSKKTSSKRTKTSKKDISHTAQRNPASLTTFPKKDEGNDQKEEFYQNESKDKASTVLPESSFDPSSEDFIIVKVNPNDFVEDPNLLNPAAEAYYFPVSPEYLNTLMDSNELGLMRGINPRGFFSLSEGVPQDISQGFNEEDPRSVRLFSLSSVKMQRHLMAENAKEVGSTLAVGCGKGVASTLFLDSGPQAVGVIAASCFAGAGKEMVQTYVPQLTGQGAYQLTQTLGASKDFSEITQQGTEQLTSILLDNMHSPTKGTVFKTRNETVCPKNKKLIETTKAEHASKLPKENPSIPSHSYEEARNKALEKIDQIDYKSKRPHVGNLGVGKDKVVGFDTKVNGVPKTYRVDWDTTKGPHINVQVGKGSGSNTPFTFPGTEGDVKKIVDKIDNLNNHTKGVKK